MGCVWRCASPIDHRHHICMLRRQKVIHRRVFIDEAAVVPCGPRRRKGKGSRHHVASCGLPVYRHRRANAEVVLLVVAVTCGRLRDARGRDAAVAAVAAAPCLAAAAGGPATLRRRSTAAFVAAGVPVEGLRHLLQTLDASLLAAAAALTELGLLRHSRLAVPPVPRSEDGFLSLLFELVVVACLAQTVNELGVPVGVCRIHVVLRHNLVDVRDKAAPLLFRHLFLLRLPRQLRLPPRRPRAVAVDQRPVGHRLRRARPADAGPPHPPNGRRLRRVEGALLHPRLLELLLLAPRLRCAVLLHVLPVLQPRAEGRVGDRLRRRRRRLRRPAPRVVLAVEAGLRVLVQLAQGVDQLRVLRRVPHAARRLRRGRRLLLALLLRLLQLDVLPVQTLLHALVRVRRACGARAAARVDLRAERLCLAARVQRRGQALVRPLLRQVQRRAAREVLQHAAERPPEAHRVQAFGHVSVTLEGGGAAGDGGLRVEALRRRSLVALEHLLLVLPVGEDEVFLHGQPLRPLGRDAA
eukprot:Rhum_TRINITY_DN14623_c9_g1::Rhum_TRINITY_DN14623_c9_g1_i1::g.104615::m.104615